MANVPKGYIRLEGSERKVRIGARLVGPADPKERLTVSVRVRRRPGAPPLPSQVDYTRLAEGHRRRVSREQFAEIFGAAPEDLELVTRFAQVNGLRVIEQSPARRTVVLAGSVEQMSRAFVVKLSIYKSATEKYRGREGPVHLPEELSGIVEGVFGLDNRRMARRMGSQSPTPASVTPRNVAGLYNFPLGTDASTQVIALLEFGGGYKVDKNGVATDIEAYFNSQGLTSPLLVPVSVDGASNSPGKLGDDVEVVTDIEVAGSVAEGSTIAVYFAPNSEQAWVDAVPMAVLGEGLPAGVPAPSVISISWGEAELEFTQAEIDAVSSSFAEAAALGVTVLVASGDNGSDCLIGDKKAHVFYPASDPWITSCGGTSIFDVSGNSFTEHVWEDKKEATGGGISDLFSIPAWQLQAGVPGSVNDGHQGRGLPDIAGYSNGYAIYVNGNYLRNVRGTSETAPLYAGLIALINSLLGEPVGYLNPLLYSYGSTAVFRDIADGRSNAFAGAPGYIAAPGWDACTGWGSVDGCALLDVIEIALYVPLLQTMS